MKKYLLLICIVCAMGLFACQKNQTVAQAQVDDAKIQQYLKTNNITMTKDPTGIYYKIVTPGTGAYPVATDTVKVSYSGSYLNGQNFQGNNISTLVDNGCGAVGFGYAVTHINTGGRILAIVPSGLAYGPAGNGTVPPNAVLIFQIDLLGFYK